jgi:hypothetical protein
MLTSGLMIGCVTMAALFEAHNYLSTGMISDFRRCA